MRLRIVEISSISHLLAHNGHPCDKYTATVWLTDSHARWSRKYALVVYDKIEAELEKKLAQFKEQQYITIKENASGLKSLMVKRV